MNTQRPVDVHAHAVIPRYHRLLAEAGVAIPGYGTGGPGLVGEQDAVTDTDDAIARRISMMDHAGSAVSCSRPSSRPI